MNPVNTLFTGSANKPAGAAAKRVQQLRKKENTQATAPWLDQAQLQAREEQSLIDDMEAMGFNVAALRPVPVRDAFRSLAAGVRDMSEPQQRCISGYMTVNENHRALLKKLKRFKAPEIVEARESLQDQYELGEQLLGEYYAHLRRAGSRFDALQRNHKAQDAKQQSTVVSLAGTYSDDVSIAYSTLKKSAAEMIGTYNRTANYQQDVTDRQHSLTRSLQIADQLPDENIKNTFLVSAIQELTKAYNTQNRLYLQCRDGQVQLLSKQTSAIEAQRLLMDEWEKTLDPEKVKARQEEMAQRKIKLDLQG